MNNKSIQNKYIRKGDKVIAIAGNNRGQTGTVISRSDNKAVVQGMNIRKKHVKRTQAQPKGAIVELEKPIHISNLRLCVSEETPVKLKLRTNSHGEKELYYRDGERDVVHRSIKKS